MLRCLVRPSCGSRRYRERAAQAAITEANHQVPVNRQRIRFQHLLHARTVAAEKPIIGGDMSVRRAVPEQRGNDAALVISDGDLLVGWWFSTLRSPETVAVPSAVVARRRYQPPVRQHRAFLDQPSWCFAARPVRAGAASASRCRPTAPLIVKTGRIRPSLPTAPGGRLISASLRRNPRARGSQPGVR